MNARSKILDLITDRVTSKVRSEVTYNLGKGDLWDRFHEQLKVLGGEIITLDRLQNCLELQTWIEPAAEPFISRLNPKASAANSIWDAEVGVSVGNLAVAQSGSILVQSGGGRERLSSLIPPVNIILINRKDIVEKIDDVLSHTLGYNSVLITGPSRTADIEGVLVRGIHGPRELLIFVVEANE